MSNRLAAAIRYTFNRSTALGLYMRMVFDLDTETFWVEASDEPQFLAARKLKEGEDPAEVKLLQIEAAGNVKRVVNHEGYDWFSPEAQGPYFILETSETKTTWHPIGL